MEFYRIRRKTKRSFMRSIRKFIPRYRYDYVERLIRRNIIKLTSNPENKIEITSGPNKKVYIQSKDKNYNVVFSKDFMKYTNHEFFLKESINEKLGLELIQIASNNVDKFCNETEDEIFKNESNGLAEILNKLE
jgi:hypothetical protein